MDVFTAEPGKLEILGQTIVLPKLTYVAHVFLTQEEIDAVERAFLTNTAENHPVKLRTRPRDRLRMFLPNRRDPNVPNDIITPWDIEGIFQKGLGPDGEPLSRQAPP